MNIKERLSVKSTGFYIAISAALVGIVAMVMYIIFMTRVDVLSQRNPWVLITMILGIITVASLLFVNDKLSDIISIIAIIIFVLSIAIGLQDAINNMVDYIQGIVMFGDSNVAMLNVSIILTLTLSILLIGISTFFKNEKRN